MIFIKDLTKITDVKYSVGYIDYVPLDAVYGYKIDGRLATKEELEKIGKLVDLPDKPIDIQGKDQVLYYNPKTNSCFWEYVDAPKLEEDTTQERLMALEKSNAELTALITMMSTPTP